MGERSGKFRVWVVLVASCWGGLAEKMLGLGFVRVLGALKGVFSETTQSKAQRVLLGS